MGVISMSKRLALRLLSIANQKVKLDPEMFEDKVYTTRAKGGIDDDIIYIEELGHYEDIESITEIEYIDKYGSNGFMPVSW